MKNIYKYIVLSMAIVASSSCKKFLDVNTNPNSLTEATPALILPQSIVASASLSVGFSQTFNAFSGAVANAGGYGGFGAFVTYDFGTGTGSGLWSGTYDNANDFQYVINETSGDPKLAFSTAAARIMKAFDFERLVNQYNDVPYSDALKAGGGIVTPKYDKGPDVYKACIAELDKAMADITTAQANLATNRLTVGADPLFKGDMELWKKFANTVKLRMLIKMAVVPELKAYATGAMSSMNTTTIGFLSTDAIVNPGYEKTVRPNPVYSSLGFASNGAVVSQSNIPTKWMYSWYTGAKLTDPGRAKVIYRGFPSTIINQLGDESTGVPAAAAAGSAFNTGTNATNVLGVAKGATQGTPVLLAAESYFLQAEAYTYGYLVGDAAAAFKNGITQSFTYLYKDVNNTVDPAKNVTADVNTYLADNDASRLVNFSLAVSREQKIEAIITQKYIALNQIANDEAFNEFRRTTYPTIVNGSLDPILTFASKQSISTHIDKLPTRILYPQEEFNLNPGNVPKDINRFSSLIFWDLN